MEQECICRRFRSSIFGALLIGQAQNAAGGSKIDRISAFEETGGGGRDEITPLELLLNILNINPHSSANMYNFSLLGSALIPDDAWVAIATEESL